MDRSYIAKKKIPDEPGVYFFKGARGKLLYVGKATSLRDRVRSYFSHNIGDVRSPAIAHMVQEARTLSHQTTDSVLEALILEAYIIKKHQPPYNIDQKDNKSWNYVVITREIFPRIVLVRGRELFHNWKHENVKAFFGPFTHGGALKEALKLIRKIFPFRDRCIPCQGETLTLRRCKPCFNRQIGLCPGVCSGEMSSKDYSATVKNIRELFCGRMKSLRQRLEREMKKVAREERFERADQLRKQVSALSHIRDVALIKDDHRISSGGGLRIEAYDVAHTAGSETVGVMTVVQGGESHTSDYRKFKITSARNNDIAALTEMLERRLAHNEWPLPRVFVVDGGTAQKKAAENVLARAGIALPVIGVVKDEFHRPVRLIGNSTIINAHEKDILIANSEAHRFGITWHRKRLSNRLLTR